MSEKSAPTIGSLGEFGLIDHLTKNFQKKQPSTLIGVGDDAAVIGFDSEVQVVTTDLLVEGVHFDLVYTPLKHLGYKAVVVNLSDVYAMNAAPRQITVSVAMSGKMALEGAEQLYEGIRLACERYNVDLVGGDTSASVTGLLISVTAMGTAPSGEIVLRSGARANDLICVTGDLGAAYMGLKLMDREKRVFMEDPGVQPDFSGFDYPLARFLKPEARVEVLLALREKGIRPTSMIDISDGLSSELLHICKRSSCGCTVYQERIPIHPDTIRAAEGFGIEPMIAALHGGEDYELLFTVPLEDFEKVMSIPGVSVIGNITPHDEGAVMVTASGQAIRLVAQGWNAYGDEEEE
ncbi:MAG: thiamine-phosphate kinase [Bacteroidota bacterium]